MDIKQLKEKAKSIRELYARHNLALGEKPDTPHEIVMEFVSDVGDLSRYITQGDREEDIGNKKEDIARELAECLSHVLVLADEYGIDLEEAFLKEFNHLTIDVS